MQQAGELLAKSGPALHPSHSQGTTSALRYAKGWTIPAGCDAASYDYSAIRMLSKRWAACHGL
jgi:hypothetical protein